eukprot:CAMPEP_0183764258 /NCGR_PEP_ID=MMETSP0739-20130205/10196_1 /TAXON_ID=385413 /ORGANISM="Thalassiosira miniscula, Strain CCMP1093" /LENGTH=113 /DNA_ID=CAMNT_0026002767 /DNA_START=232 /DNA_END=575 /DNA_ORIENTATION=+
MRRKLTGEEREENIDGCNARGAAGLSRQAFLCGQNNCQQHLSAGGEKKVRPRVTAGNEKGGEVAERRRKIMQQHLSAGGKKEERPQVMAEQKKTEKWRSGAAAFERWPWKRNI